jgi:intein/homing endonuclease
MAERVDRSLMMKAMWADGRRRPIYSFNEKAFDIVGASSAYWLGFIAADGYIATRHHSLVVSLNEKDRCQLEALKAFLSSNHKLNEYSYPPDGKKRIDLKVRSKYLLRRLSEFGIIQKMSGSIRIPNLIPEDFEAAFIRGFFDGDGCLTTNGKAGGMKIAWTSKSVDMLRDIQERLIRKCGLNKIKLYSYKNKKAWDLAYGGNEQVKRIVTFLLNDGGYYLPRKLGRYGELR